MGCTPRGLNGGPGAAAPGAFWELLTARKVPRRRQTSPRGLGAFVEWTRLRRVRADVACKGAPPVAEKATAAVDNPPVMACAMTAPFTQGGLWRCGGTNGFSQLPHFPREATAAGSGRCRHRPLRQNRVPAHWAVNLCPTATNDIRSPPLSKQRRASFISLSSRNP